MVHIRWFGHAAHFICGDRCRFHMATQVGKYLVSTVGEMWSERSSREIHASIDDPTWHAGTQYFIGFDAGRARGVAGERPRETTDN